MILDDDTLRIKWCRNQTVQTKTLTTYEKNKPVFTLVESCDCKDRNYCESDCKHSKYCRLKPVAPLTWLVYLLIFLGCLGIYWLFIHFINQIIFK